MPYCLLELWGESRFHVVMGMLLIVLQAIGTVICWVRLAVYWNKWGFSLQSLSFAYHFTVSEFRFCCIRRNWRCFFFYSLKQPLVNVLIWLLIRCYSSIGAKAKAPFDCNLNYGSIYVYMLSLMKSYKLTTGADCFWIFMNNHSWLLFSSF